MNHYQRRKHLMQQIGNGIAVIPTAPHQTRNSDVLYPYRPDSDFYYLTHFREPEAVAVLCPGSDYGDYILFCRERNPEQEIWDGYRAGTERAVHIHGADVAYSIESLDEVMPKLLENRDKIHYRIGRYPYYDEKLIQWLNKARRKIRNAVGAPSEIVDISRSIHELRNIKQDSELPLIETAANISVAAHRRAMQACKPGLTEYQIQAELEYCFNTHNATTAYHSIVAGGENACVLHYIENSCELHSGDLLLIDAGAEYDCYAADITRTFPVNGKFTAEQKEVYEVVLEAQKKAIEKVKAGNRYDDVDVAATEVIVDGLVELGILKDTAQQSLETKSYKQFYMHKIGHWLGLDVHDVGEYRDNGSSRQLCEGMYMTVEPGIYLAASEDIDPKWHGIGIRIEDDVLVSNDGNIVTTKGVPKDISEIEYLMSN